MGNRVYIILLNYNGWRDTQECLESLFKLNYQNYQIVVVDNNSPNASMAHLLSWAKGDEPATVDNPELIRFSQPPVPKPISFLFYEKDFALHGNIAEAEKDLINPVIFIQSGENNGFAAGNNVGVEYVLRKGDADYIWFLNNDTVVDENTLFELDQSFSRYKKQKSKVGIVGAKLLYYSQPNIIQSVGGTYDTFWGRVGGIGRFEIDNGQYDTDRFSTEIDYPVGASMFVDVEFIKDVGLMSEEYFLFFEELDWVLRGKQKGWEIGYCWQAKVFHKEGGSIGSNATPTLQSEVADYYGLRSRFLFTRKFYPYRILMFYFTLPLVVINRLRRGQFSRVGRMLSGIFKSNTKVI